MTIRTARRFATAVLTTGRTNSQGTDVAALRSALGPGLQAQVPVDRIANLRR